MAVGSLDKSVDAIGFGPFHIRLCLVATLVLVGESIELFMISFVVTFVACEWKLTEEMNAMLSTIFFVGLLVGNYIWGFMADAYGRKRSLVFSNFVVCYFGLLSAFSPTYIWFMIHRTLVGVGIAGSLGTMYPLFMELTPSSHRHVLFCIHPIMGALAGVLLYLTGWQTIPLFGWRVVVALGALPSFIATILVAIFVPRSPRHLLLMGEKTAAQDILKKMATTNGRSLEGLRFELEALETEECEEFGFGCLFARKNMLLTLSLLLAWLCIGFLHYGTVLLGTVLPYTYQRICNFGGRPAPPDTSCGCRVGPPVHVVPLVGGALGEIASLVFPWLLANFFGRRFTFCVGGALAACISGLHVICKTQVLLALVLFFNRAVTLGLFLTAIRYTTEVYPTSARAVGLGLGSSANRVGNLLAPFVAQVLVQDVSLVVGMIVFVVVGAVVVLIALVGLRIETKGRPLFDTFAELHAASKAEKESGVTLYQTFSKEPEKKSD